MGDSAGLSNAQSGLTVRPAVISTRLPVPSTGKPGGLQERSSTAQVGAEQLEVPMRFAVTRAALPQRPIAVSAGTFLVVICAALVILCAMSRSAAGD
jgi:hypothetical protein